MQNRSFSAICALWAH